MVCLFVFTINDRSSLSMAANEQGFVSAVALAAQKLIEKQKMP